MAYTVIMQFVDTPVFTKEVERLLKKDEYWALQLALILRPEQGALMTGTGGLRKIRWGSKGRGKRGGVRVIYFWEAATETLYFCWFTQNQTRKILRRLRSNY